VAAHRVGEAENRSARPGRVREQSQREVGEVGRAGNKLAGEQTLWVIVNRLVSFPETSLFNNLTALHVFFYAQDKTVPASSVKSLPAVTTKPDFPVQWSGSDSTLPGSSGSSSGGTMCTGSTCVTGIVLFGGDDTVAPAQDTWTYGGSSWSISGASGRRDW